MQISFSSVIYITVFKNQYLNIVTGLCVDERNVFVMAERVHEYFLLSVSRLRRYFENSLSTKPRDENTFNKSGSSHLDFVLLSFMMGNDYLPKFKGASLPKLWPRYITLKRGEYADSFLYNPSTETFNVPFLQALMSRPRYNRKDKDDNQNTAEQKADSSMPNEPPNNVVNSNNANTNKADEGNVGDENVNEDDVEDEKQGDMPEMTAKDEAEVRQWIETHGVQMTDDILESEVRTTHTSLYSGIDQLYSWTLTMMTLWRLHLLMKYSTKNSMTVSYYHDLSHRIVNN